jgi:hypothetical protein
VITNDIYTKEDQLILTRAQALPAERIMGVETAPESIAQLTGAWAYSRADCDKLFQQRGKALAYRQPVDKFAQAAIVESHRIRLPSATCQIDRASSDSGALGICNVKCPSGYVLPATEPSRMQTAADVTESGKHDLIVTISPAMALYRSNLDE